MPGIALQHAITYGPVLSRRLGRSFGINLLPIDRKICSFDCIYCQYGKTTELTLTPDVACLPKVSDVLSAVEKVLKKPHTIDTLTFSGNGEPTLHPQFPDIVGGVRRLRDDVRPEVKLAVLSNSSRVTDPSIVDALSLIDEPMMKLDAGDEGTYRKINQPVDSLLLDEIIMGLQNIKNLIIQSVLIEGEVVNSSGWAYEQWASTLSELHPHNVHIYSTERPTSKSDVSCLSPEKLQSIEEDLRTRFDLNVDAFWRE